MHIRLKDLTYPAIALVVALLLRYLVVESTDLALHCDMHRWEGWCGVRTALVAAMLLARLDVKAHRLEQPA